jgi:hypothetical protein
MTKTRKRVTLKRILADYSAGDRERICLQVARHPQCGVSVCQMAKGHEASEDRQLQKHQAACRKHHCCIVSWGVAPAQTTEG